MIQISQESCASYFFAPTQDASPDRSSKKVIREHGCEIVEDADYCMVTFPEGTKRAEIFPRMYNERYTITLPDGAQMKEMYDRCQENSLLFLMA